MGEELGKVKCPVCGTEYDDSVLACPKCGAMGLQRPEGQQIKREGVPVSLPPPGETVIGGPVFPLPPQPYQTGPLPARGGYGQQYGGPPGPYGYRPRVVQSQEGWGLGLGITGIFLGMGGMMLGILGTALGNMVCGWLGLVLCILAIVMGVVLVAKGQRIGIGVLAMGAMGLMMLLIIIAIFLSMPGV